MTTATRLVDLSLSQFTEELARRTATPGGGSVAAHLAAQGAALSAMAFRFTTGAKFAAVESDMMRRADELDKLRARSLELVDRDSRAYDAVSAAYKLPKNTDEEKSARTARIESALKSALAVPYETMQTALAALSLCAAGASDVNANVSSDCGAGALALAAALEAAWLNVATNARSIQDAHFVRAHTDGGERMRREARGLEERALQAIAGRMK
jgi:formiminotetrahydrofolate cyclodeaminase